MIRALIFDFDGLILDTETPVYYSWQELYSNHGGHLTYDQWAHVVGTISPEADQFSRLEEQIGHPVDRNILSSQRLQREHELIQNQPVLPGVRDILVEARKLGLKIGVASSAPCQWVVGHLQRLELVQYFDKVRGRDDVQRVKPDPELFLTVLADLKVDPQEAVVFEDSPNGIRAAKAAGLLCVVVPNPVTRQYSLAQADLRLESLADLTLQTLLVKIESLKREGI